MKFDHIGFIVKNGKKVTDFFDAMLGKADWKINDYTFTQDCMIVGNAFVIRTYNAIIGGDLLEIIEPLEGDDSYFMQCVENSVGGMHHLAYAFTDNDTCDEKVEELKAKGYVVIHASERVKGHKTYYLSLPEGSPAIELKV